MKTQVKDDIMKTCLKAWRLAGVICCVSGVCAGVVVAADLARGMPAPVNAHKGMQVREEVFAFAKKVEVGSRKLEKNNGRYHLKAKARAMRLWRS
jgi:hypothetical protein